MTREERVRAVAEAIAWMREDGGKFPGWGEDRLAVQDRVASALLEALLLAYPEIRLVAVLAACRAHWIGRGPTTPAAWCRRIQNWCKCGAKWGDPLVTGTEERQGQRQGQGPEPPPAARPIRPIGPSRPICSAPIAVGAVVEGELAKIRELIK